MRSDVLVALALLLAAAEGRAESGVTLHAEALGAVRGPVTYSRLVGAPDAETGRDPQPFSFAGALRMTQQTGWGSYYLKALGRGFQRVENTVEARDVSGRASSSARYASSARGFGVGAGWMRGTAGDARWLPFAGFAYEQSVVRTTGGVERTSTLGVGYVEAGVQWRAVVAGGWELGPFASGVLPVRSTTSDAEGAALGVRHEASGGAQLGISTGWGQARKRAAPVKARRR